MRLKVTLILIVSAVITGCSGIPEPDPVADPSVLIIMYHRITEGEAANIYERSMDDLEKDFLYLRNNNIRVIDFSELAKVVSGELKLTTHAAILTFDDGDHSWYTVAMPLLKKYRMKATFFLWASKIGMDSFLSWDEVEMMSSYSCEGGVRPFSFGSHTMSHAYLLSMKTALGGGAEYAAYLDEELGGSKQLIENHIYGTVSALALPYGDGAGDADIIAAAQRHGYGFIRTSERGLTGAPSSDLFRLPSLPMLNDTYPSLIGDYLDLP
jgi:peptidoglycan/xylan/chitin deacetylase (PgdA/CDA1 family)